MINENWKNKSEGRFEFQNESDAEVRAFLDFLVTDTGNLVIKHTEVDESLSGQGVGKALLNFAFDYARRKEYKIIPICPFAKNVMYNNLEEYRDLL